MSGTEGIAIEGGRLALKMGPELERHHLYFKCARRTSATIHNQQHPTGGQAVLPSHHSVPKATAGCGRLGRLAFQMAKRRIEQVGAGRERAQDNCESRHSNGDWPA